MGVVDFRQQTASPTRTHAHGSVTVIEGVSGPQWAAHHPLFGAGLAIYGKWSASLVESNALDIDDVSALEAITGYGDTPLEAAASLLAQAAQLAEKRRELMFS